MFNTFASQANNYNAHIHVGAQSQVSMFELGICSKTDLLKTVILQLAKYKLIAEDFNH